METPLLENIVSHNFPLLYCFFTADLLLLYYCFTSGRQPQLPDEAQAFCAPRRARGARWPRRHSRFTTVLLLLYYYFTTTLLL
jgi:hypothetical protein